MVTLEACPLFRQLAGEQLKSLQRAAREKTFAARQDIFKEGDQGDGVYVVKDGQVQISGLVGPEVRRVFSTIQPGEIFGEMAVLENKPRSAGASAATASTVYFIPRDDMLKLVQNSPALAFELLREISNRLREFNRQYLTEVLQTERLAIVGRFARSIVHDLKNPLNIIGLSAEVAGMPKSTPASREAAGQRIAKQVDRISEMVNEILEFTQGSQATFVPAAVDYAVFIEQLLEEIRPEIEIKSATIEVVTPPPSVNVPMNPKRLRRVFYNLIHNATDAMPSGGKIFLRFQQQDGAVVTEIEDSGSGIAPEIAERLFDAFATHGKAHGTGLGLSICKKIIEDHRGEISARNSPGRGAIFSFTLPLNR